jgi:chromate transporter
MGSFNGIAALLSLLAAMLIFRLKRNIITTLAVTSLAGLVLGWAAA